MSSAPSHRPVRTGVLGVLALSIVGALLPLAPAGATDTTPASATGASEVAPERPPVFHEGFENAPDTGAGTSIRDYVGSNGARFGAHDFWADRSACNGIVLSASNADRLVGDCKDNGYSYAAALLLARALGVVNHTETAQNSVVTAYTEGSAPDNAIEMETTTPIALAATTGRFLTASVNAAALNCYAATKPALRFFLVADDGVERPVSTTAIDPCTDDRATDITIAGRAIRAGHFDADSSLLVSGESVRVVMRNEHGNGSGNDHAFDDIRIIDATPVVDVAVTSPTVLVGQTTRLSLTVRNTPDLAEKAGWSLATELPEGLRVASEPRVASTCPSGEVSAAPDSTTIAATGAIGADSDTCTIELDVVAGTRGVHNLSLTERSALLGLDAGTDAALTVIDPVAISNPVQDGVVETAMPTFTGTGHPGAAIVVLDADGLTECTTTVEDTATWACVATEPHGSGPAVASAVQRFAGTTSTAEAAYRVLVPEPALSGTVAAEHRSAGGAWVAITDGAAVASIGDELRFIATLTNDGNVPLGEIAVHESPDTGLQCTESVIEPGTVATCVSASSIRLTAADIDRGSLTHELEATAVGLSSTVPTERSSSTTGRLPLPDRPTASTGAIRSDLGLVWALAPLEPQSPLARTGSDVHVALFLGAMALLFGAGTLGFIAHRRRRGADEQA